MTLDGLKLTEKSKPNGMEPVARRRLRFLNQIAKQASLVERQKAGETPRGRWYWQESDGTYRLSLKYGRTPIEIAKGKFSVECTSLNDILTALNKLEKHASSGAFDEQITKISGAIRRKLRPAGK